MYAIIAMGEEPYCIENTLYGFYDKTSRRKISVQIPWLQRCGEPGKVYADGSEGLTMYKLPDEHLPGTITKQ
jgi:hypothetical protein